MTTTLPLLRPTLDVVFKMLFARKRGHTALIGLLNAILKPSSRIESIEVLNPEIPKLLIEDKGITLDIHARLADGTMIDVEMQMASHNGMAKRALYYACRMYSSELKVGELYDSLRPAVVIFLLAEDLFNDRPREFELGYSLQQDDSGPVGFTELIGELQIKFYEIVKAFRLWQERQLPSDDVSLGAWLGFLADPMSQAVEEACMSIPDLKDAKTALEELSSEAEAREIARMREMARIHWASLIGSAKAEGKAEGIAEGEAKGKAEASLMFLKMLLSAPETKDFIDAKLAQLTGLSVAEVAKARGELK